MATDSTSSASPDAPSASRGSALVLPLLAAALVIAVYAFGSWSNQFVYDDHQVIENQFPARGASDVLEIFRQPHYLNFPYYRPLTRMTFALQQTICGNNPRPYHLFNATLAGLVFLAAYGLLRRPALRLSRPAALIAALWFAMHPALSECVYPAASGRETLLPALAMLLATWAYLHRGPAWYWLALALLAAALLCKEQAAALPAIFVLVDISGLREKPARRARRMWLARWAPIVLIFAGYFLLRRQVLGQSAPAITILDHPAAPFLSLLYGWQTAVLPFVSLHYEPALHVWFNGARSEISLLLLASVLALFGVTARGKESALRKPALFWLGWFVLLQLPTAHLFSQEAPYSERYAALAILAIPAMLGLLFDRLPSARGPRILGALAIAWTAALAAVTLHRGESYADDISFCTQWTATDPASATAHAGLAYARQQQADIPEAIAEYDRALRLDPRLASAHNGLANILADRGDFAPAARHYEAVLRYDPNNVQVMVNYAQTLGALAVEGHSAPLRDLAHDLLTRALRINPDHAQAHYIMAIWEQAFGNRDSAIEELTQALRLRPNWPSAQERLEQLKRGGQMGVGADK